MAQPEALEDLAGRLCSMPRARRVHSGSPTFRGSGRFCPFYTTGDRSDAAHVSQEYPGDRVSPSNRPRRRTVPGSSTSVSGV